MADRPLCRVEWAGDGLLATIVLDRPQALNAVDTAMARAISAAAAQVCADPQVRAVVLASSSPRAFCAGADLRERHTLSDAELAAQRPVARGAYRSILDLPVPAVAAVDGFALGGGLELALACDIIVAGADAVVGLPEVSVGVVPGGGGTQLLPRRVGWAAAASMIFTARRLTAEQAHSLGVVDEVVPAGQARRRAQQIAGEVAGNSPVAVRAAKLAMRLGSGAELATGLEVEDAAWRSAAFSPDRAEGVAAYVQKRTPRWSSRSDGPPTPSMGA